MRSRHVRPWDCVCGSESTSLRSSLGVRGRRLAGREGGPWLPSPGPLDSCWLLGRLLSSGVMVPERQVLSPDGVPIPVALCVCRTQTSLLRCSVAAEPGDSVPGRRTPWCISPLHCPSLWGFFPPASKQGHGWARARLGDRTQEGGAVGRAGVGCVCQRAAACPRVGARARPALPGYVSTRGWPLESEPRARRHWPPLPNPAFLLSCWHLSGLVRSRTPLGKPDATHACGGLCPGSGRVGSAGPWRLLGEVMRGHGTGFSSRGLPALGSLAACPTSLIASRRRSLMSVPEETRSCVLSPAPS